MKIYRRLSDGFEIQDERNRDILWAVETYSGEFVEITPEDINQNLVEISEKKKFLSMTDYKVIRQMEQNTLSNEEWLELIYQRQRARDRINFLMSQ